MSGIERIGPSGPQGPGRTERPRGAEAPPPSFELRASEGSAASAPAPDTRGAAARMRKWIDDGLAQGLSKEEVLEQVVESGIRRGLGPLASPEVQRAVTRTIQDSPAARELFDRLYARAVQARA